MLTSAAVKTIIQNNFNDDRIFSIQAFINRLIDRKVYGDGIAQYRIKNKIDNSYVTSLADFVSKIDAATLVSDYFYNSVAMTGDRVHPFVTTISNFIVELDKNSKEDNVFFSMFGEGNKSIAFIITYVADGDTTLPLKIIEVKLL